MPRLRTLLLAVLVPALAVPAGVLAQGRGKDQGKGHDKKHKQHDESDAARSRRDRTVVVGRDGRGVVVIDPDQDRNRRDRNRDDDRDDDDWDDDEWDDDDGDRDRDGRIIRRDRNVGDRIGRIIFGDRNRDRDRDRDRDREDRLVFRDRDGRIIVIGDDDIDERFRHRGGNGPPFCRSGAGHPVHGRRWCLEKGWGLGRPGDIFFGDGEIFFWDDEDLVIVRDSRFRRFEDRRVDFWERALSTVLFWMN